MVLILLFNTTWRSILTHSSREILSLNNWLKKKGQLQARRIYDLSYKPSSFNEWMLIKSLQEHLLETVSIANFPVNEIIGHQI